MNPLRWPRAHQLAALLIVLLGAMGGYVAALLLFPEGGRIQIFLLAGALPDFVIGVLGRGAFAGAVVAGTAFYVVKLLRTEPSN